MSGYAWIVYWICLNMPEYTRISVNISKSVRAPFVSHAPIVIPCLLKRVVTHFDEVYSLKEHEAVSWRDKFWFFLYRPVEEGVIVELLQTPRQQLFWNPYRFYFQDWLGDQTGRWAKPVFLRRNWVHKPPKLPKIHIYRITGRRKLNDPSKLPQELILIYSRCSQISISLRQLEVP